MLYKIDPTPANDSFLRKVESRTNSNLTKCLQCYKCGGMCQKSAKFDYTPRQLLEQIIDGLEDTVLNSRAIWICETCDECQVNCPAAISVNQIMKTLREMAREKGIKPNTSEINRRFVKKAHCPKKEG
ncbi:4Fe-4S dicluster domain-containing protein [Selenihalanaerobacter shriftii]|uniref:Heterodisulfide reductase subunit C n=1 Tax=Selenihalanaerobacter shriftii TaxID=142842 RepID=A0A1T4QD37_9FIRM|nr:4Fe-4S dicluster domain-containing protein [Selenihalanaerobacter shriftii]SKA01148.1 heterodisulfide reductase subunit C [Selenihalanaerobacter shriftii]